MDNISNEEIFIEIEDVTYFDSFSTISVFLPDTQVTAEVTDLEINYGTSGDTELPSWVDVDQNIVDEYLEITINHTPFLSLSAQLLIATQYDSTLNYLIPPLDSIDYLNTEINFTNLSNSEKQIRWNVSELRTSGVYSYEVQVWWNSGFKHSFLINSTRDQFYIPTSEPQLLLESSSVGDMSLLEHQNILTLLDVPSWSLGEEIELRLKISDEDSDEFVVHYQLLHYFLFAADQTVLRSSTIPSDSLDKSLHFGTFIVPEKPVPLPDDVGLEVEVTGEIFVLLFFIRDNQGNSIIEPIFFQITDDFNLNIPLLIMSGVFVIGFMTLVIILIKRTSRRRIDPYSITTERPESKIIFTQLSFKFCIHCGRQIPKESAYCGYCGEDVRIN